MLRKVEWCSDWHCVNEAEGTCQKCGRLLCEVHAYPHQKQRYCHNCFTRIVQAMHDARLMRDI